MEKLYFLSLHNAKKETNDIPISISNTAVSNSGLTMFLAQTLRSMRNLFFTKQVRSTTSKGSLIRILTYLLLSEQQSIQ